MMAIDALELSVETQPDVVILVTGDADFAYLATKLRRRGIRVEVASAAQNLGNMLRATASEVIDLAALFRTFEMKSVPESPTPVAREPQQSGSPRHSQRRRPARNASHSDAGGPARNTSHSHAGGRPRFSQRKGDGGELRERKGG
jgi:hypothetical protein